MTTDTVTSDTEINEALKAAGLEIEYWNTGGGCMVTYVILSRDGEGRMARTLGITNEHSLDEDAFLLCLYDEAASEALNEPTLYDGVLLVDYSKAPLEAFITTVKRYADALRDIPASELIATTASPVDGDGIMIPTPELESALATLMAVKAIGSPQEACTISRALGETLGGGWHPEDRLYDPETGTVEFVTANGVPVLSAERAEHIDELVAQAYTYGDVCAFALYGTDATYVSGDWLARDAVDPDQPLPDGVDYATAYHATKLLHGDTTYPKPLVTRAVAERIVADQQGSPFDTLRWEGDTIVLNDEDGNDVLRVDADSDGLYDVGFGWTWDIVTPTEAAELVGGEVTA